MNWILKHCAPVYFLLPWVDKLLLLFLLWWICPSAWLLYYKMATIQGHTCSLILGFFDCEGLTPNPDIYCRGFYSLGQLMLSNQQTCICLGLSQCNICILQRLRDLQCKESTATVRTTISKLWKILHSLQPCLVTALWQIKVENLSEVHWHLFVLSENVMIVQCGQTQTLCCSLQSHHISNHWDIFGYWYSCR